MIPGAATANRRARRLHGRAVDLRVREGIGDELVGTHAFVLAADFAHGARVAALLDPRGGIELQHLLRLHWAWGLPVGRPRVAGSRRSETGEGGEDRRERGVLFVHWNRSDALGAAE